ncbi:sulfurtransferase [Falsirhodobacter xinxiangensis]|uniref:sulfurtransferase n=1 Tax=Falsirhodobacter xinxiangensis TaxID=2530049 RepID=UPI0010AAFB74|nr:rhodanese-like domain-containing protein [Rhodobacter xinxiangensis]
MKILTLGAMLLSSGAAFAADLGPLVTPAEVQSADQPLVLDIRGEAYGQGHIAGAVAAPYALFRGPAENPGALVPEDQLEATLRSLGVTTDRPIVIVHQGKDDSDFGSAARVYWTLKSSGLEHLSILNGGMAAWADAGLPLETRAVEPVPSDINIEFSDRWLAKGDEVAQIVGGQRPARLLDARPVAFYQGQQSHPAATKPGTLPGAESVEHSVWFSGPTEVLDAAGAARVANGLGLKDGEEVVAFCNTGHWAATEWFALSELAGVPNVKLYPDSVVGWSQQGNEMANTPGLLQNLVNQIRGN